MQETKIKLDELKAFIDPAFESVDVGLKKSALLVLKNKMTDPSFWDNPDEAAIVSQDASNLEKVILEWETIKEDLEEMIELFPEISPEKDEKEAEDFKKMVDELEKRWRKLEISTFLNGKYDKGNAILMVHAGTGGTDASDFSEMLLRMYLRYIEKMGFKAEIIDKSMHDEAGIKSATIFVQGAYAYGYLRSENGVHRLVRLSPFNSKHTRETSFSYIEVTPEVHMDMDFDINEDDLRVDVFRSSGAGGQSVNTTDSAIRITHLPTGIVVSCQNERSQHQNKEYAMKVLKGKLVALMEERQAKELDDIKGAKVEMSWGNQIRSYVLHPYKMVKDHRTGYEEGNPDKVLDGEIDGFIEAYLKRK